MASKYTERDFESAFGELRNESDRGVIVIGSSLLEHALESAIGMRLREPSDSGETKRLFDESGLFGTFSKKIWAAYFLKIIGTRTRRDLDLIRRMRNIAAHSFAEISFDTPEVAGGCRELKMPDDDGRTYPNFRERYLTTVHGFSANLLMRAGDHRAEIGNAYEGLAPFLDL